MPKFEENISNEQIQPNNKISQTITNQTFNIFKQNPNPISQQKSKTENIQKK